MAVADNLLDSKIGTELPSITKRPSIPALCFLSVGIPLLGGAGVKVPIVLFSGLQFCALKIAPSKSGRNKPGTSLKQAKIGGRNIVPGRILERITNGE